VFDDCGDDKDTDRFRNRIFRSDLNDAWPLCVGYGEDASEIEIVGEQDEVVIAGKMHDRSIGRFRIAECRPVLRLNCLTCKVLNPDWAETHVDENLHFDEIGTSNSSDLHAAYASASLMSSASR